MAPSHYLNQSWNIVSCTFRNKLQWNINRNSKFFIQIHLKMWFVKWRPFCLGLNVLKSQMPAFTSHTAKTHTIIMALCESATYMYIHIYPVLDMYIICKILDWVQLMFEKKEKKQSIYINHHNINIWINSLRPNDAYMHRRLYHQWFR